MRAALALIVGALFAGVVASAGGGDDVRCRAQDPLRQPWFGDLHVHTRHSLDASTQGTRTTPREAYQFARGEAIGLHPFDADGRPGRTVKLSRPLDFAAVTDHSELFGEVHLCNTPGSAGYESAVCRIYRRWPRLAFFYMNARGAPRYSFCGEDGAVCRDAGRGPWQEMQDAAAEAQDTTPECRFTSFVGYEWTKSVETASNLHRNVIFANDRVPGIPASSTEAGTPTELWRALEEHCREGTPGCEAIVIPHNSNLSGGFMFAPTVLETGAAFDADYARKRARNEPLVELVQHKGDSECRLGAGTEDELCDFEALPYDTFMGRFLTFARGPAAPINFVRTALGAGLGHGRQLGVNPFAFGVIGSTDTHLGTPGLVGERDYPGHGGAGIPIGVRLPEGLLDPIEYNPGGLAVLWAEENSRPSLFAAMKRRESYSTSGPRITLRLFAGFGLPGNLCEGDDFARRGYAQGIPMGGDLPSSTAGAGAPTIAAWALRDPGTASQPGMPLQRLQVIKLSLRADGEISERVVDIAGNADNGAGVDAKTCQPYGEGFDQLCAVWSDPEFEPGQPALYYTRVVENPTCRWSTRFCNAAGVDCKDPGTVTRGYEACCDDAYPKTLQERAVSSPIWYTPDS